MSTPKDVIHIVNQIKENLMRGSYKRTYFENCPRSEISPSGYSSGRPASNITSASSRPTRTSTPLRSRNMEGSTSRGKAV